MNSGAIWACNDLSNDYEIYKHCELSSGVNVGALLSKEKEDEMKHHREMMLKLLNSIRFLVRHGLPFRGHREDSESMEGNLYQLLLLQSRDSPQLASWLEKTRVHLSKHHK